MTDDFMTRSIRSLSADSASVVTADSPSVPSWGCPFGITVAPRIIVRIVLALGFNFCKSFVDRHIDIILQLLHGGSCHCKDDGLHDLRDFLDQRGQKLLVFDHRHAEINPVQLVSQCLVVMVGIFHQTHVPVQLAQILVCPALSNLLSLHPFL